MSSILLDYADVFIMSYMSSGMQRQTSQMTHGIDTIIWNLLEGTFRQRVGRMYISPRSPFIQRWVARPGREDLTVKRAQGQGPHFHSTLHIYKESRRDLGALW